MTVSTIRDGRKVLVLPYTSIEAPGRFQVVRMKTKIFCCWEGGSGRNKVIVMENKKYQVTRKFWKC